MTRKICINNNVAVGGDAPLMVVAGLCVIENLEHTLFIASELKKITSQLEMSFVLKASYDKANRSSIKSYRGPGLNTGLKILAEVKQALKVPILTDVHCRTEVEKAAEVADILQIPAFLCRQTDLILSVASTGKPVNVKKGQFLAPWDTKNIIDKILSTGNDKIMLTERGTTFGYNNLVVDFRSLVIMRQFGFPVIFDATHSVQLPGGLGSATGGQREFIHPLTRAAVAVGVDAIYLEVHDQPDRALSDGPNSLSLSGFAELLKQIKTIDSALRNLNHSIGF
ncbi:MAG: 3-deoxy-8-phosphooctulonate synthase [Candidatus Sumerlaeia bacterium]|nr:3-deoxy-8-phosphooctulonate synthase [Candidatus Sumerlaeia bacterium]